MAILAEPIIIRNNRKVPQLAVQSKRSRFRINNLRGLKYLVDYALMKHARLPSINQYYLEVFRALFFTLCIECSRY